MGWFILAFGEGYIFWGALAMSDRISSVDFFFSGGKVRWEFESTKVLSEEFEVPKCSNKKLFPYNSSIETSIRIPGFSAGASPYHRVFSCQPCGMETPPCYQKLMVTRPNQHEHHPTMLYQHGFKQKKLYILVGGFNPFERYQSKWESSTNRLKVKKISNQPPPSISIIVK